MGIRAVMLGFISLLAATPIVFSCSNQEGGGIPDSRPSSNPKDCDNCAESGGTLAVNLQYISPRMVNFSLSPTCKDPNDYLICDITIFNDSAPQDSVIPNVSPLIFSWQRANICQDYLTTPLSKTLDCQYSCVNNCVWITVKCSNTTRGTNLTIDGMPANVNC